METKAVIYARVSSESDRQDTSRQIEDLKRYANQKNMEIVNIYEEHISGAKKNEERVVLTECLEYCRNNSVEYLLLSELSRLGRSTLQVLKSYMNQMYLCISRTWDFILCRKTEK